MCMCVDIYTAIHTYYICIYIYICICLYAFLFSGFTNHVYEFSRRKRWLESQALALQVYEHYLLWGLMEVDRIYFGLFGAPAQVSDLERQPTF